MLSDYALRVLMFAAAHPDRLVTIEETLKVFPVSRGHIMKVVLILGQAGFLRSQRGRSGGFTLAVAPADICLGDVLRATEPDYRLTECFGPNNTCTITAHCRLPTILNRALDAFMAVMDSNTLADLMLDPAQLGPPPKPPARPPASSP